MSLFWTMRGGVEEAGSQGATAGRQAAARRVGEAEDRVDRALLACEAMWSLLREKLGLTDIDLVERFNQLDLTDGKLDGKMRKTAVSCPKCGKAISRRMARCMYCGQAIAHDPFV
jgi:hypothetical protein